MHESLLNHQWKCGKVPLNPPFQNQYPIFLLHSSFKDFLNPYDQQNGKQTYL